MPEMLSHEEKLAQKNERRRDAIAHMGARIDHLKSIEYTQAHTLEETGNVRHAIEFLSQVRGTTLARHDESSRKDYAELPH